MNKKIVEYLRENKDKHQKDDLVAELKKTGYSEVDIDAGVYAVYEKSTSQSLDSSYNDAHDKPLRRPGFKYFLYIIWRIIFVVSIILLLLVGGCFLVFTVGNI